MVNGKAGEQSLSKDEEQRLGESLRKALISSNPNPNREGCPDPKIIRDLALHKKIDDPQAFERITLHMAECSACVRDALRYVEEYKERRKRNRQVQVILALVATVVVAVALWTMWRNQSKQEIAVRPGTSSVAPIVAENGNRHPGMGFETAIIELPSRWRGAAGPEQHTIVLKRGRLRLEIRLPVGSSEGMYQLRILDKSGNERKTAVGTAYTEGGSTNLKIPVDTSELSPGNYGLSILEPGIDEWAEYRITVK